MVRIGLLSDTHGYLDPALFEHFKGCDEVWHAGDLGTVDVVEQLETFRPTRAVWGNVDGPELRLRCPEHQWFERAGLRIWMTHIGGAPPRYNPEVRPGLQRERPDLFVCGHSHILRVQRDAALGRTLYINPGAAGQHGFHRVRTCVRFGLDAGKVVDFEVIELGKRGAL